MDDDDSPDDEIEFEFELTNSDDMSTVVLVCTSSCPLAPDEYAQALRAYADRIEAIATMSEVSAGTIN